MIEREKAAIGVLISMEEPTGPMRSEAASAGFYESPWDHAKYPRLQLLTIEELLGGKVVSMPPTKHTSTTFKRARRAVGKPTHRQKDLL